MGKVLKQVKENERKKRMQTEEFIEYLLWYIKATQKTTADFVRAQNDINEAFNAKIKELKEQKQEEQNA